MCKIIKSLYHSLQWFLREQKSEREPSRRRVLESFGNTVNDRPKRVLTPDLEWRVAAPDPVAKSEVGWLYGVV